MSCAVSTTPSKGWHWPANSQRAHYFAGGESLCEEYVLDGDDIVWNGDPPLLDTEVILTDLDCPVCAKRLWKAIQLRQRIKIMREQAGGDDAA